MSSSPAIHLSGARNIGHSLWRWGAKNFRDFYSKFPTSNGEVERLLKHHMEKLGAA